MIQCVGSSYCIDNLIYTFSSKEIPFLNIIPGNINFYLSCCIVSNVISHVSRDNDIYSGNVSLIQCSVSDGQKTCSSKGVSRMYMYIIQDISCSFSDNTSNRVIKVIINCM